MARQPSGFLAGSFGSFAILGGVVALYGATAPLLQRAFSISPSVAGLGLSVHAIGATLGVLAYRPAERHIGAGRVLAAATLVLSGGLLLVGVAPAFALVLAGYGLVGVGFGVVHTGVNTLVPRDDRPRIAGIVNAMHATFGVGAVLLPLVLAASGRGVTFTLLSLVTLATVPAMRGARPAGAPSTPPAGGHADRTTLWQVAPIVALFGLYLGVEGGVANWHPTHLDALGWEPADAARFSSAFWAAFTVARFAVAPFASRVRLDRVVVGSLALATVSLCAAAFGGPAPVAYLAVGLFLAPVFPTALVWLARAAPLAPATTTAAMLAANLGVALLPALVGAVVGVFGTPVIPLVLTGIGVVTLATALVGSRRTCPQGALVAATASSGPAQGG